MPIIFLTAAIAQPEQPFLGYAAGAVDYLAKPFDPGVLTGQGIDLRRPVPEGQPASRPGRTAGRASVDRSTVRTAGAVEEALAALLSFPR